MVFAFCDVVIRWCNEKWDSHLFVSSHMAKQLRGQRHATPFWWNAYIRDVAQN